MSSEDWEVILKAILFLFVMVFVVWPAFKLVMVIITENPYWVQGIFFPDEYGNIIMR